MKTEKESAEELIARAAQVASEKGAAVEAQQRQKEKTLGLEEAALKTQTVFLSEKEAKLEIRSLFLRAAEERFVAEKDSWEKRNREDRAAIEAKCQELTRGYERLKALLDALIASLKNTNLHKIVDEVAVIRKEV